MDGEGQADTKHTLRNSEIKWSRPRPLADKPFCIVAIKLKYGVKLFGPSIYLGPGSRFTKNHIEDNFSSLFWLARKIKCNKSTYHVSTNKTLYV